MAGLQSKQVHGSGTHSYRLWTILYNSHQLYQTKQKESVLISDTFNIASARSQSFHWCPTENSMFALSRSLPHACCPLPHLAGGGWATKEKAPMEILNPKSHHHLISNQAERPKAGTTS